MGNTYPHLHI